MVGIEDGVGEEVGGAVQAAVAHVLRRQSLTQVLGHLYVHLVNNRQRLGEHVYTEVPCGSPVINNNLGGALMWGLPQ